MGMMDDNDDINDNDSSANLQAGRQGSPDRSAHHELPEAGAGPGTREPHTGDNDDDNDNDLMMMIQVSPFGDVISNQMLDFEQVTSRYDFNDNLKTYFLTRSRVWSSQWRPSLVTRAVSESQRPM